MKFGKAAMKPLALDLHDYGNIPDGATLFQG